MATDVVTVFEGFSSLDDSFARVFATKTVKRTVM